MSTFFVRDAARMAVHTAIEDASSDIVALSRALHDGAGPQGVALIAALFQATGFAVDFDTDGIEGTIRAVYEQRDTKAERRGLRHAHVAYLADLPDESTGWANDGANLAIAATITAAIGLAASLKDKHEFGFVTFMAGPHNWKAMAAARGLVEPFDAALGVHTAAAGQGFAYTIDNTGDRLGSLAASVSFEGGAAALACEALLPSVQVLDATLASPRVIRVVDTTPLSARFEILGRSRSELIETAVELKDRADSVAAEHDATVDLDLGSAIDDMIVNRIIIRRVKTYGDTYKLPMDPIVRTPPGPASDWGNVSYITPSADVAMRITDDPVAPGTSDFGMLTASDEAHAQAILLGECIAMTGIDVLRDSTYRAIADDQLVKALAARGSSRAHRRWLGVNPVIREPKGNADKPRRGPTVSDFRVIDGTESSSPPAEDEDGEEPPGRA